MTLAQCPWAEALLVPLPPEGPLLLAKTQVFQSPEGSCRFPVAAAGLAEAEAGQLWLISVGETAGASGLWQSQD